MKQWGHNARFSAKRKGLRDGYPCITRSVDCTKQDCQFHGTLFECHHEGEETSFIYKEMVSAPHSTEVETKSTNGIKMDLRPLVDDTIKAAGLKKSGTFVIGELRCNFPDYDWSLVTPQQINSRKQVISRKKGYIG
eukprot:TRINITY_DN2725_c0_g1_i1.p1 TRINITY_DN2725_c0_g1~~TRINITY_DN2725_c0_g1_i1.p1  ORF type:complete len:136 (+),score=18.88 TRINITY_DN2725_c0_g1_i1:397-804(+)